MLESVGELEEAVSHYSNAKNCATNTAAAVNVHGDGTLSDSNNDSTNYRSIRYASHSKSYVRQMTEQVCLLT